MTLSIERLTRRGCAAAHRVEAWQYVCVTCPGPWKSICVPTEIVAPQPAHLPEYLAAIRFVLLM